MTDMTDKIDFVVIGPVEREFYISTCKYSYGAMFTFNN